MRAPQMRLSDRRPGAWAGQGAGVVEGVFAQQALGAGGVDGDQARDHFAGGHGLRVGDRLLISYRAGPGMNGNVRHTALYDAALIADAEIDSLGPRLGLRPNA